MEDEAQAMQKKLSGVEAERDAANKKLVEVFCFLIFASFVFLL